MPALTITIPPNRAEFAARRAAELGLASPDELVCWLLDAEDRRLANRQKIESLVAEGLAAEPGELVTDEWWAALETEVFGKPLSETNP